MSVMAWSLSNEDRAKVRSSFIQIDKNQSGTITMFELKTVLAKQFDVTDEEMRKIFDALDAGNSDEINYTEFLAAMVSSRISMHDDLLRKTFQRFDTDNSGFISKENLKQVLVQ